MTSAALQRTWAIVLRQIYLVRGSAVRVLPMFAWVAVDMVLWGFITRYLNAVTHAGLDFVASLLGAVLLWDFFGRVMQGVTTAFLEDVWSRNFLNLFASPLSTGEYLSGLVVSSIITSAIGLVVMLGLATLVFGLSFFSYGVALLPFVLILFGFGIALGIAASGIVLRFGPASEWLVWPIPAMIAPFAGVFYPLGTLPRWMQVAARLVPPSAVFEAMRGILAGQGVAVTALWQAGGLAVIQLLLACWFYQRVHRRALRVGLIARYSAESLD
jgi:ABC-2 type transport system permease protein